MALILNGVELHVWMLHVLFSFTPYPYSVISYVHIPCALLNTTNLCLYKVTVTRKMQSVVASSIKIVTVCVGIMT